MKDPDKAGWYFIHTSSGGVNAWECALFNGESWDVIQREYSMSAKEVGILEWRGPIQMPLD